MTRLTPCLAVLAALSLAACQPQSQAAAPTPLQPASPTTDNKVKPSKLPVPVRAFEAFCYRTDAKFSEVKRLAMAYKLKPAPPLLAALGKAADGDGESWIAHSGSKNGEKLAVLLGASDRNVCSVFSMGYDKKAIIDTMMSNYHLKSAFKDETGLQITEMFVPNGTTGGKRDASEHGIITLTQGKDEENYITIAFAPPASAAQLFSQ